jgi:hypothetical protein
MNYTTRDQPYPRCALLWFCLMIGYKSVAQLSCEIKLVDISEMNHMTTDQPRPRCFLKHAMTIMSQNMVWCL